MKLLKKTNRWYLLMFLILFIVAGLLIYLIFQRMIEEEINEKLLTNKALIVAQITNGQHVSSIPPIIEIRVLDNTADSMLSYRDTFLLDVVGGDLEYFRELRAVEKVNGTTYHIILRRIILEPHDFFYSIGMVLVLVFLLLLISSVYINHFISKRIWQPFYSTLTKLKTFSIEQKEKLLVQESNIQEFNELNNSIESLTSKIQSDYGLLKSFSENASHEIQTPLAIMRAKFDELIQQEDLSEKTSELVIPINAAIDKLSRINKTLILLTKIENRQYKDVSKVDLSQMLERNISDLDEFRKQKNIELKVNIQLAVKKTNPMLVEILISNLLTNAIKHNIESGWIEVDLSPDQLILSNSGVIYQGNANNLFNRFTKSNPSSDSLGLGLSICKSICDFLGWKIEYHINETSHQFLIHF